MIDRIKSGWNAFMNKDPTPEYGYGMANSVNPDRVVLTGGNERSILTTIITRLSLDVSAISIKHIRVDDTGRFVKVEDDSFNQCLTVEANIDQTGRQFIFDACASMLDEGVVCLLPTDTTVNPNDTESFEINKMRVGKIVEWYPKHVKVDAYDERDGRHKQIIVEKRFVSIIENPFYSIMNEPNSTFQRLRRKLVLLDRVDEAYGSNKLNLIIQLPYVVKTERKMEQAQQRLESIETQLSSSPRGIAYTDATEKITQLNRPVENQLLEQIEYLTRTLYSQLGINEEILNGTADEKTMTNYMSRIIEPILSAFVDEMKRKFLSKTARTQGQSIAFFTDPFRLVPITQIAEVSDKLSRNEIMSSNEIRQRLGLMPSSDPKADELRNSNMPHEEDGPSASAPVSPLGLVSLDNNS